MLYFCIISVHWFIAFHIVIALPLLSLFLALKGDSEKEKSEKERQLWLSQYRRAITIDKYRERAIKKEAEDFIPIKKQRRLRWIP